jgi:hypothetical protein
VHKKKALRTRLDRRKVLTLFTASSQAFFSSVEFALLTFTTSLSAEDTATERGPRGRSDSGEDGDRVRLVLGLGVRVVLVDPAPSVLRVCADFFGRAIILVVGG